MQNAHMQEHVLASYFRVFDVILCSLPGASYSINGYLPLAFTSFLSIFSPIFSPSSHVSTPDIHICICTVLQAMSTKQAKGY
jgi:hypothetical protein